MRLLLLPVMATMIVTVTGCGSGTAQVSGKVTYKGRLVTSGSVIALNADGTATSAVIHLDGTYALDGVKRGLVRFGVLSPDPAHARSILKADENRAKDHRKGAKVARPSAKASPGDWFPLPHHLGDPEKSGLQCEASSSWVVHDIEMD